MIHRDFTGYTIPDNLIINLKRNPGMKQVILSLKKGMIFLFMWSFSFCLLAQNITVRGTVTDASGVPVIGANVIEAGTTNGTVTDVDGNFSLQVEEGAVLHVSYIGYLMQEVNTTGRTTNFTLTLIEDRQTLDEVVVIGYGTQMKRNVVSSISSINADDLDKTTTSNITQNLQGKIAGISALQNTGQPGADVNVKIRGNPSFASSGVLYVLDGIPLDAGAGDPGTGTRYGAGGIERSPLNFINPNDIESIDVLKDASSASIYGARAGAGVILITTKKGKTKGPKIDYNVNYVFQKPAKFYNFLSTNDYMETLNNYLEEMWMVENRIGIYGNNNPALIEPYKPRFTKEEIANAKPNDAAKAITRNGGIIQHNLSVSGLNGETIYYISGNYFNQEGLIKGNDYKRYTGRVNLEQKLFGDYLRIGVNVIGTKEDADNASVGQGTAENGGIIANAMIYPPHLPLIDENGDYPLNELYAKSPNPLSMLEITDISNTYRSNNNAFVELLIIPNLTAKANFGFDVSSAKRSVYFPRPYLYGETVDGDANIRQTISKTQTAEFILNYDKNFGSQANHKLGLLAGYSYQKRDYEFLSGRNYGFLTDQFLFYNLGLGSAPRPSVGSSKSTDVWASYFTRAIYSLNDRYLLQAALRRDGNSNFAQDKKYGLFPSLSAGWIISDEPFFQDNIIFLNFLKLRSSYGITGNSAIGSNAFAYYSSGNNYIFGVNKEITPGVYMSQLANNRLTWESSSEINFGIDFQLMKNRISGSFDIYNRTVSGLLNFRPLPLDFPVSSVADNSGKTRSKGWEIELQSRNVVSKNIDGFRWSTEFTLSKVENNWVERSPELLASLPKYIDPKGPFNPIYGYVTDGIYQGNKDVPWMPGLIPGHLIIKDLNGYDPNTGELTGKPDGTISSADQVLLGSADPKLNFGFNNTFYYKNFDLSIYMYGATQIKWNQDYARLFNGQTVREFVSRGKNQLDIIKESWSHKNQGSKYPSGMDNSWQSYGYQSDFWNEQADFLRCREITLGYTIPSNILINQKVISGLRISFSSQNVFVITNYSGLDPELYGFYAYPNPLSFVANVMVSF